VTPTVTVRAAGFRAYCRELARMSGKDYREVLTSELASCVKIAALESPIASKADIERQVQERAGAHWETNLGEWSVNVRNNRGRVWFWDKDSGLSRATRVEGPSLPGQAHARQVVSRGGFYLLFDAGPSRGHHLPDAIWMDYLASRELRAQIVKERTKEVLKRRGTERLSWLQIGDAVGVNLANVAPQGNLRENMARGSAVRGRQYHNGTAQESTSFLRFQITITNASPAAIKRFGQRRIEAAMVRRRRAFDMAMKKGLFGNLHRRARNYPGIFVKPV
jgi:hypothetical protein